MRHGMKLSTKAGIYQGSNVNFFPQTEQGFSYGWWKLVTRIDGKLIFNSYYYSSTTCRHQSKMRILLEELGLKIDLMIEAPNGLQDLHSSIALYNSRIEKLREDINKPRSHSKKNEERRDQIKHYMKLISVVKTLIKKDNQ